NYDEEKVGAYTLPDPLVLPNGRPVREADAWFQLRRPEILRLYETEIYGRIPARVPRIHFEVVETETNALNGLALRREIIGRFGDESNAPPLHVHLYLPNERSRPVPVLLHMVFFNGVPSV